MREECVSTCPWAGLVSMFSVASAFLELCHVFLFWKKGREIEGGRGGQLVGG